MTNEQPIDARALSPSDWKAARAAAIRTAYRTERGLDRSPAAATVPMQPEPAPSANGTTASTQTPPPAARAEPFNARNCTSQEYATRKREIMGGRR